MSAADVVVQGVSFAYPGGGPAVLDELSIAIDAGERVAVLGPNGSGKTTFALHLNGLLAPRDGTITIGGVAVIETNLRDIRRAVGFVFQDPDDQLFMHSVADDVGFGPANLGVRGAARTARVDSALAGVGASHLAERNSHHLSGGEKRRVAIATVLAMQPDVLVLDEPTSGLDPRARRQLGELLATFDCTQVLITHDLPFALATCPRAVILDAGRIVADGPTRDVLADPHLLRAHDLELPFGYVVP